jgi:hypothetical protein
VQYKLLKDTGKNIEADHRINKRALAYLGGFINAAMRAQKDEIKNGEEIGALDFSYLSSGRPPTGLYRRFRNDDNNAAKASME